ncbi:MAG: AAA family ATPase [Trichloromonas sp.]|jgi:aminoglycoside phosphotransferase family enzyme/predicted kinase|nr:AAA family ATPase [Trichloromonas sp.]
MEHPALHQAMLKSAFYPGESGPVDFHETHISRLYFTHGHVYKVKKPVNFQFLDFTTLENRHFYCNEELRLNQRLCSDTYLDVLEIRREGDSFRLGAGSGEIVDYLLRMKRLPEGRMLSHLLAAGDPSLPGEMERLGRHLAHWHRAQPPVGGDENADLERIRRNGEENLRQSAPLVGSLLTINAQNLMRTQVEHFLTEQAPLLRRRQAAGQVIDGHGDLHAEHICLTDPIRIYDCIEFNDRFRLGDRLADLAFLLMDLDYRGRRDLSADLLQAYDETWGTDSDAPRLLCFYKSYRAWVRGKVLGFLAQDPEADAATRADAIARGRRYFSLALGYLCPPGLVLTCGLMGTGKSVLAAELATALGAVHLRSDELRKELAGLSPLSRELSAFGEGLYQREATERTYRALADRTETHLAGGHTVIVDASFAEKNRRDHFRDLARRRRLPLTILWMDCPEELLLERLRHRRSDASDGRPELLEKQKEIFQSPLGESRVLPVDTRDEVAYNVQRILCHLADPYSLREQP